MTQKTHVSGIINSFIFNIPRLFFSFFKNGNQHAMILGISSAQRSWTGLTLPLAKRSKQEAVAQYTGFRRCRKRTCTQGNWQIFS
jgi:hypothetical protein